MSEDFSFHHDEAGIFKCFCFIRKLWIRWGRYQLQFMNLPTASSNHAGGAILSLYDNFQPSNFKFCYIQVLKNVKNCSPSIQAAKSISRKPWGSSNEILLIYYLSLLVEGGANKIYQFFSFFWLRQGGLSFYGSHKGDEGADTDLMFQFCLPSWPPMRYRTQRLDQEMVWNPNIALSLCK